MPAAAPKRTIPREKWMEMTTMDRAEKKCLDDIEKYGCHIIHVFEEGELPPFSYSVGLERSIGRPELIIIGLRRELAHYMINEYCARARAGETFSPGMRAQGFLDDFDCEFRTVSPIHYEQYTGWDIWLYGGTNFRLLQLVYPSTTGAWPWDEDSGEAFQAWQPVLET
jgi:hypothetical protein